VILFSKVRRKQTCIKKETEPLLPESQTLGKRLMLLTINPVCFLSAKTRKDDGYRKRREEEYQNLPQRAPTPGKKESSSSNERLASKSRLKQAIVIFFFFSGVNSAVFDPFGVWARSVRPSSLSLSPVEAGSSINN